LIKIIDIENKACANTHLLLLGLLLAGGGSSRLLVLLLCGFSLLLGSGLLLRGLIDKSKA